MITDILIVGAFIYIAYLVILVTKILNLSIEALKLYIKKNECKEI